MGAHAHTHTKSKYSEQSSVSMTARWPLQAPCIGSWCDVGYVALHKVAGGASGRWGLLCPKGRDSEQLANSKQ